MSKRRNKNKGQSAGKGGKPGASGSPAKQATAAAVELPAIPSGSDLPIEDLSAMLATSEMSSDGQDESEELGSAAVSGETDEQAPSEGVEAGADAGPDDELLANRADDAVEEGASGDFERPTMEASEPMTSSEAEAADEPVAEDHTPAEFEDMSAALARAIPVEPTEVQEASQLASIQIPESSTAQLESGIDVATAWDSRQDTQAAADGSESTATDAGSAGGKSRKKLKLNKLQKHTRTAEPEAEIAAPEPEPAPVPRAPREPRIPAFAKLSEFQVLSLSHIPGVPEEADVPGHWRGVGFGIGGHRLVSAFDEVVEIMRLPQITHVPGTQPWMLGVANVRGTLLPVVDLKQFLEGERTVMHEGQRVLVVRQAGGNVAVLIDQLFGQRSFNDSQKTDETSRSGTRYDHFIKQFYRVGDNDWGVFSMSMLTRTPEFRQAAA